MGVTRSLIACLVFAVAYSVCSTYEANHGTRAPILKATPEPTVGAAAHTAQQAQQTWVYRYDDDEIAGKKVWFGELRSENQLRLAFPYQGQNYGQLSVRQSPRGGLNAYVEIERGQLLCRHGGCSAAVRFDDGAPQVFTMLQSNDHSSTVLFFSNARRVVEFARKARVIRVELTVYKEGQQVLEFRPAQPLEWPVRH